MKIFKTNITSLRSKFQKHPIFKSFQEKAPSKTTFIFAVVAIISGVIILSAGEINSDNPGTVAGIESESSNLTEYSEDLQSQVDDSTGSPRSGRDPAAQSQASLAEVASRPTGAGTRTDKPAAGVSGNSNSRVESSDIYGDPKTTGINSAGCYFDYGKQGEHCVPAHAVHHGPLTCAAVNRYFENGVKVTGKDRFNLDKNNDGIACGQGD